MRLVPSSRGSSRAGPLTARPTGLPLRWKRDLSYGTYLYAFPVQQILESGRLPIGQLPFFGIAIAITLGLAWFSWTAVERPVIGLFRAGPAIGAAPGRP